MNTDLNTLNSCETQFLLVWRKQQISEIDNSPLTTTHSARNLGFIFEQRLTFSDEMSALSIYCYYHISELHCILPYIDFTPASAIDTCIMHSQLHYYRYCNSLFNTFWNHELNRRQQMLNCLGRPVVKATKCSLITAVVGYLQWLNDDYTKKIYKTSA